LRRAPCANAGRPVVLAVVVIPAQVAHLTGNALRISPVMCGLWPRWGELRPHRPAADPATTENLTSCVSPDLAV